MNYSHEFRTLKIKTMSKQILTLFIFLFSNFLTSYSQDIEGMFNQGEQKKIAGDYHTAIGFYTKVLNSKPDHLNALLQRAFCHSIEKNYQGAIDDYTKVIAAHPEHVWAYISRGSANNKLKQFAIALPDFDKALSLNPESEEAQEALNNRGWAKQGLGDHDGACKDWNESKKKGNEEAKIILKNTHCK
jgi:tetratricopeptide (TPR) repeat protein